jgi:hypothetical protein
MSEGQDRRIRSWNHPYSPFAMTEAASRVPAWKRLGLALKNEAQAGVAAPESTTTQIPLRHQAPYDSSNGSHHHVDAPVEPAVSGSPSKLGKRKHQLDAAEQHHQTAKKGKTSATEPETNLAATIDAPATAEVHVTKTQITAPEPLAQVSGPKGDPNYRKKKEKPNKKQKRNHEDTRAKPLPPPPPPPQQIKANHDRSALSPDAVAPSNDRRTLLASTEILEQSLAPATTPPRHRESSFLSNRTTSGSPGAISRRKSVTFTPDTKRVDGSSGQDLFKKWVADQKDIDAFFDAAEAQANSRPTSAPRVPAREKQEEKPKEQHPEAPSTDGPKTQNHTESTTTSAVPQDDSTVAATTAPVTKGKKKDPSIYIAYLTQYHNDRPHWKFNKAKQNDVVDNALNIFRIPDEHSEALLEYVQGLKGAGVVERLTKRCEATITDIDEVDAKDSSMDDAAARKAIQDEALQAQVAKEQKRRKVEGDLEGLAEHPHSDGYIRRLRRKRAEALLTALGRAAPILPATRANGLNPLLKNMAPMRDSKKRKRRGDISSDESSSDSSSDDSSSSESDSDDDSGSDSGSSGSDSKASSSDDDSSDSDADSDNGSGPGSDGGDIKSESGSDGSGSNSD